MATITKVTYQCDICKRESADKDFNNGSECGSSVIHITGSRGGKSYNGDWGGMNHDDKFHVCYECASKVKTFIGSIVGSANQ